MEITVGEALIGIGHIIFFGGLFSLIFADPVAGKPFPIAVVIVVALLAYAAPFIGQPMYLLLLLICFFSLLSVKGISDDIDYYADSEPKTKGKTK